VPSKPVVGAELGRRARRSSGDWARARVLHSGRGMQSEMCFSETSA
jgi:hypothetical protein